LRPKKTSLRIELKLKRAEEIEIMLDAAGLDVLDMTPEISDTAFTSQKMKSKRMSVC
jgi:hypothetical protein